MKYSQEVSNNSKKDAVIALTLYVIFFMLSFIQGTAMRFLDLSNLIGQIIGMVSAVLTVVIVFVVVLKRKQAISSIGIFKENQGRSLRLGFCFALIPLVTIIVAGIFNGWELNNFGLMMYAFLYIFILAAYEDVFYVGYVQTRLYGLIKNDRLAVATGAALFALGHIPFGLAMNGMEFLNEFLIFWLIWLFFAHRMHVLLFKRYFSLFSVIVLHTLSNYAGNAIWRDVGDDMMAWVLISGITLLIGVEIWYRLSKRRSERTV